ncbi:hypothetical protein EVAR_18468_1 [Eumeta japonica]|uniref:Uncharacterized protein n=1 Tax=Eumeta variegata TaxID=151549 RepID=A0A4C1V0B4_EUMVA|nr:hypothetical protein EVAR_18468_1 [Eumeta japonica]
MRAKLDSLTFARDKELYHITVCLLRRCEVLNHQLFPRCCTLQDLNFFGARPSIRGWRRLASESFLYLDSEQCKLCTNNPDFVQPDAQSKHVYKGN